MRKFVWIAAGLMTLQAVPAMILHAVPAMAQMAAVNGDQDPRALVRNALSGDAPSAYLLGYYYQTGSGGLKQDYQQAIQYYTQAAKHAYVPAEVNLANMYATGMGVEQDTATAARWYYSAALTGQPVAENALGNLYYQGDGVPKDFKKAFEYFTRAQKHGSLDAAKHLGDMYLNGEEVAQSDPEAVKWYTFAAEKGNAGAQRQLAALAKDGRAGALQGGIAEMYRSAAEKGDANAQYNLGELYEAGGNGIDKDMNIALKWYRKGANQGQADAQNALGHAYFEGKGVAVDVPTAWFWFSLAASNSKKEAYGNDRDLAALKLTPEQLTAGQQEVQNFKPKLEGGGTP